MRPTICLQAWRQFRGLSQWELARRSGVGYATIARMEIGKGNPTVGVLARLAEALGAGVADLFVPPGPKRGRGKRRGRK